MEGAEKGEPYKQKQMFLTDVQGSVKKLGMLRNEIGMHVVHDFVGHDMEGGIDREEQAMNVSTLPYNCK